MINADLYSRHKSVQITDALHVVNNYMELLTWSNHENILDVGTGDGVVMLEILLPKLPENFTKLTALDFDENMLKLARSNCKDNPKIEFVHLSIASSTIPLEFRQHFNHIFSFYCLQLVKKQREAFQNMFNMLKPGGEILLIIIANHVVFDVYQKLAQLEKWRPFMSNFADLSPYQNSVDAVKEMEQLLRDVGFAKYKCEMEDRRHSHPFSSFWMWASAVNPFIKKIPIEELDNFKEDYMTEVRKHRTVTIEPKNGSDEVHVAYQALIVFASKANN